MPACKSCRRRRENAGAQAAILARHFHFGVSVPRRLTLHHFNLSLQNYFATFRIARKVSNVLAGALLSHLCSGASRGKGCFKLQLRRLTPDLNR